MLIITVNLGKWALANLFQGLIKAEEKEIRSTSPATTIPSITRSPAPSHISIDRPNGQPATHRARALSSLSQTPSLNILGIATPAARPAVLPDIESPLSRSAPANYQSFHSLRNGQSLSAIPQSPGPNSLGAGTASPAAADIRGDYFSVRKRVESSPHRDEKKDVPPTPGGSEKSPAPQTPAPSTPGGKMMGKFKVFGKKKDKEVMSPVVENEPEVVEDNVSQSSKRIILSG